MGGTQRWHQSNSFYVHPWAVSPILTSAHLEKGGGGGAGLSSEGRTQHPPSISPFSSSLPLLFSPLFRFLSILPPVPVPPFSFVLLQGTRKVPKVQLSLSGPFSARS